MKVLVTGGGGFLGSAIARQLNARGDTVIAYQRRPAPDLETLGIQCIRGDVADAAALENALAGCDAVIHTAGKAGVWGPAHEYHRVNVTGTDNVIQACRSLQIRYLVHTSSPSIVHAGGDIEGGDESLPCPDHFASPYPATKAVAERRVLAANAPSLRTTALRPHLIWGPGDPHLLPRLLKKVRRGRLALPGADKLIDTVYVDNAAHAHLLALDELQGAGRCAGKPYFISNDEPLPQGEVITRLLGAAGHPVAIRPVPAALALAAGAVLESGWKLLRIDSEPPLTRWAAEQLCTAHWYDLSAAKRDLAYVPRISIAEGLERLARCLPRDARDAQSGFPPTP